MRGRMNDLEIIMQKITANQLFDEEYYKSQFEEELDEDLLLHYLNVGFKEGKNPSQRFNNNFYLDRYKDVKNSGMNPLIHYMLYGKTEKRLINPDLKFNPVNTRLLTKSIFDEMAKEDSYFSGRWDYIEEILLELSKLDDCFNILEMGPYKLPLVKGEDVIDINAAFKSYYPIEINKFIQFDCSKTPYPIKDKEYDLVIACQVLEHLGIHGEQKNIFDELERISSKAIISLPYKWFSPVMRDHHMIDKKVINHWAKGRKPIYERISTQRIIQIYDFD